jgi:hypothetical protein
MHIVAIDQLQGNVEEMARNLAQVLGITAYECRPRVGIPGGGPAIIASFSAKEQAISCADRLRSAGFHTVTIDSAVLETDHNRFLVKQITFTATTLELVDQNDHHLTLPYAVITLLLRGAGILTTTALETTTKKEFALGRAVATGGLMMRKKVTSVTASTTQDRQPFCHLYAPEQPAIVLRQSEIDYSALGENRQLSRDANFTWICTELRRRCVAAQWDNRLQTRPGLAQLLGRALDPERHLDVAITLLVQSYRHEGNKTGRSTMEKEKTAGSCLCGSVTFEITGAFTTFYLCHCERCRKDSGSAHAANLFSPTAQLTWLSGTENITTFTLPETRHSKSFCAICGSALPIQLNAKLLQVPAGCLDGDIAIEPTAHIFFSDKANWDHNLDNVPKFDALPR